MYLLFITSALCLAYFLLYQLFSLFFKNTTASLNTKSVSSIVLIVILSFISYAVSLSIEDKQLSNRVLHAFGGGFLSFLICFRIVKDSKLKIGKFQFFVFSFMVVCAMGVGNEVLEFFLQKYTDFVFANSPTDTWLDLMSNTAGTLIGSVLLVPFLKK